MVKVQDPTDELVADRYRLVEIVHREEGRVGWHGQDLEFRRPVALTRTRLPGHPRERAGHRTATRVLRESERMELVCPGKVATVVDVIEDNDFLWTVTERPAGAPLSELLAGGPLNYFRAARIGLKLLDVLSAAHRHGQTHGDLSPGQVHVDEQGDITVSGFGMTGETSSVRVTAPSYASPEQARGESTGPAADLWALGAIMYAMVEGRPPFKDRGRLDATLRAVQRLPIRSPQNAGALSPAIGGLLRRDPHERVPEPVVREALTRILRQDDEEDGTPTATLPHFRDTYSEPWAAKRTGGVRRFGRPVLVGGVLATTVVCFAVLTTAGGLPDGETSATGAAPSPSATSTGDPSPAPSVSPAASPTETDTAPQATKATQPTPTPTSPAPSSPVAEKPTPVFSTYNAPEGFSIDLPKGFKPLRTDEADDLSYRVTLGASGDPRTLTVTYSTRLGPDPVEIWADLEPSLRAGSEGGYERVGEIRAVTQRGYEGADMEWLSVSEGVRERTLGRGFLIGDGRGFSLRWTTPADDWDDDANQEALDVLLKTFREPSD
ncbi:serine/threonine-protein kinase [Streptomyces sp. NPDC088747]|uniref:serine/threonine-protein kinase n=1 Tax=Streptomyces sp. NPDC088747 TaxID=3365886 RepID=UPI0038058D11